MKVGADAMQAMYVGSMRKEVNRIVDLKAIRRIFLPEKRV